MCIRIISLIHGVMKMEQKSRSLKRLFNNNSLRYFIRQTNQMGLNKNSLSKAIIDLSACLK